jgi:hypothetical protein
MSRPEGYFCPRRDQELVPCNPGEVSNTGYTACSVCSLGTYSPVSGGSVCLSCPAGYECPRADQPPTPCPIGTYSTGGQTACYICRNGYYTTYLNSTRCYACPPGYACANPKLCPKPCPAGMYMSNTGATACNSCNGQCSSTTRLFQCGSGSCIQGQTINCTDGQYIPVYTCSRS